MIKMTIRSKFRSRLNKLKRFRSQSHDPKMIDRIMTGKGLFGQNIAKRRPGRTPEEATQRMRQLRATSPMLGQRLHNKRIRILSRFR